MALGTPANAVVPWGATAATAASASFTPAAGTLLVCMAVGRGASAAIPTVSDSVGGTWTPITAGNDAGSITSRLFTKVATAVAQTVTVSSTGATQAAGVLVGVTSAEIVSSNIKMDTAASGTRTVTMNAFGAGGGCLYFLAAGAGTTWGTPTGYTEVHDGSPATNVRVVWGHDVTTPGTAVSSAPTAGSIDITLYGVEIREPSGTSVTVPVTGVGATGAVGFVSEQTAWNPLDKTASVALSGGGGDYVATFNPAWPQHVRSVARHMPGAGGKFYAEFTPSSGTADGVQCGVAAAEVPFATQDPYLNGVSVFRGVAAGDAGGHYVAGAESYHFPSALGSGSIVCLAVDFDNGRAWLRINGGIWNNSGTANPATNVGGYAYAPTAAQALFATSYRDGGVSIIWAYDAPFNYSKPSGFAEWQPYVAPVVAVNVTVQPTGVTATGAVGTVTATGKINVSTTVTGNAATGAVGSATASTTQNASTTVTGVSATAAVGTVTVSTPAGAVSVTVPVTGNAATGAVGTATATGKVNVSTTVTGVAGTGAVGTVGTVAGTGVSVPLTGVAATGAVGTATATGKQAVIVQPTGVTGTGAAGGVSVSVGGAISVPVAGVAATGAVGTVVVTARQNITTAILGVAATGAVGTATASGKTNISVPVTGVAAIGAAGTVAVTAGGSISVPVTGVLATGAVGAVSVSTGIAGVGVWTGTAWVQKPAKVWTGSAWMQKPAKVWTGSAWI